MNIVNTMREEYSLWIKAFLPVQIQNVKTIPIRKENGLSVKDHTNKNGHKKRSLDFNVKIVVINFLKQFSLIHINNINLI
jgi:hypothetical protein